MTELQAPDYHTRVALVLKLFATLARPISDAQVAAIASATASMPLEWLAAACRHLGESWMKREYPGAPEVARAGFELAGFRPRRLGVNYYAPLLARVCWWPAPGRRAPVALADQWDAPWAGARCLELEAEAEVRRLEGERRAIAEGRR